MTDTDQTTDEDIVGEDDILFMRDGRIRIVMNGVAYMLRRPNLGQFKGYRLLITNPPQEVNDGATDVDYMVGWFRDMFASLSDKPLPESEDDMAPWLVNAQFAVQLIAHWQEVPLGRGARSAQGQTQPNVARLRTV